MTKLSSKKTTLIYTAFSRSTSHWLVFHPPTSYHWIFYDHNFFPRCRQFFFLERVRVPFLNCKCKWLSAQTTFNNFTPPTPKKGCFLGGVTFLDNFTNFWVWNKKNFLVRLWTKPELLGYKSADFCRFRSIYGYLKFKKSGIFSIFGQIWQLFFSKFDFGPNWS